jgi:MscS family membrane protein
MIKRKILFFFLLLIMLVGCGQASAGDELNIQPTVTPGETAVSESNEQSDGLISSRDPRPTATPGVITISVENLFAKSDGAEFLWLDWADWVNLFISLLIAFLGYVLGSWILYGILGRVVARTQNEFDNEIYKLVRSDLRWLIVVFTLRFATMRLIFLNSGIKSFLNDVYFIFILLLLIRIAWKLIDFGEAWYREKSIQIGNETQLGPAISWIAHVLKVIAVLSAIVILLAHYGIDVFGFAAALGLTGFAVSLAAKDTIADVIAGMIIIVDQPFRVGDRIEIQSENTWGDVSDIGLRTTRIRTRDNRMVIVPNSIIGKNQVINYTFPDPRYRIQTHVSIGYGTDVKRVRDILVDTVRQVEGVLADKPVDALYIEMSKTAMIFLVRWWIESYEDTRRMFDKVHSALQDALDVAGIEIPNDILDVNLKTQEDMDEQ